MVVEAIDRWRQISIPFHLQRYLLLISTSLQYKRAPCLEQLYLVSNDDNTLPDNSRYLSEALPRSILQGGVPKFTQSVLYGMDLDPYYSPLTDLRDMPLRAGIYEYGMSYTRLLRVLRSSPGLEQHTLDRCELSLDRNALCLNFNILHT